MKGLLPLLFVALSMASYAQRNMHEVEFTVDGQKLSMPYGGGFNSLIICKEDLNRDGKKDLLLYDKSDYSFIGFRNEGGPGEINYVPDESLVKNFPVAYEWMYLIDYDFDGAADLFTISPQGGAGFALYKGRWEGDRLAFDFKINRLEATNGYQLYTSANKLPAIDDINGDGDIDILVFDINGSTIQYFENQSVEQGSPMDTFIIKRKSNCWGYICECSATGNSIDLGFNSSGCFHQLWNGYPGAGQKGGHHTRHSGSTIMTFDPDNDGDKDVLLGDAGFSSLVFLENSPAGYDSIIGLDTAFPSYDVPVLFNKFPAPYYIDIDNDGQKDLLVSTYSPSLCTLSPILDTSYNKNLMYYRNVGTGGKDTFSFRENSLLVKEMLDVGFNVRPAFFDHNRDGLLDIVVGRCYERDAQKKDSIQQGLVLFENTGSATAPKFESVSQNFANLQQYGYMGTSPDFADLDNDGDQDMILGLRGGELVYFRNEAGAGNEASFTRVNGFFDSISQVSGAAPQVVDVDEDGLLDLLIGEKQGRVFYYRNHGTKKTPLFRLENSFWGEVDARQGNYYGYAIPWLGDADGNGERELLVTNMNGQVLKYTNVDGNLDGTFTLADTNYLHMDWGGYLAMDVGEIDGNGKKDFLLGNYRGGLRLRTFGQQVGMEQTVKPAFQFHVYPNPASEVLTIRTGQPVAGRITLYNITGSRLISAAHNGGLVTTLDVSDLPGGLYIVEFSYGHFSSMKKVFIRH